MSNTRPTVAERYAALESRIADVERHNAERFQAVESTLVNTTAEQRATRTDLVTLSNDFKEFAVDVRNFMRSSGKLDLKLVGTFAGVGVSCVVLLLSIGALYLKPHDDRLTKVEQAQALLQAADLAFASSRWTREDHLAYDNANTAQRATFESTVQALIAELRQHFHDHQLEPGHPMVVERVDGIEADVARLLELVDQLDDRFDAHDQDGHPDSVLAQVALLRDEFNRLRDRVEDL